LAFVVLPQENAQGWFDARRAFHGSKAKEYYGKTQLELEAAMKAGLKITAEVRFLIEGGDVSLLSQRISSKHLSFSAGL
jgi:hypothetical protein